MSVDMPEDDTAHPEYWHTGRPKFMSWGQVLVAHEVSLAPKGPPPASCRWRDSLWHINPCQSVRWSCMWKPDGGRWFASCSLLSGRIKAAGLP